MRRRVTRRLTRIQAVWVFDTQTTYSPTLSDIEALCILKQKRNLAEDNLFGGLKAKFMFFMTEPVKSLSENWLKNLEFSFKTKQKQDAKWH